jgi:hypothetical protein
MTSIIDFNQHMFSRKHKNMMKKDTIRELRECHSAKKFLIKKGFITNSRRKLNKMRYFLYINSLNEMLK